MTSNNIILISGSSRDGSVNRTLLAFIQRQLAGLNPEELLLTDYKLPIYDLGLEIESGIPESVQQLKSDIDAGSGYVLVLPEHNGSLTALFKSTIDWLSRIDRNIFGNKPVLLASASPGPNGGKFGLAHAETILGFLGASIVGKFSQARFSENFDSETGQITDQQSAEALENLIQQFKQKLDQKGQSS